MASKSISHFDVRVPSWTARLASGEVLSYEERHDLRERVAKDRATTKAINQRQRQARLARRRAARRQRSCA